jgi:TPP-dependent pyruvate/acetoin dehydrogenase alpha subunit
VTHTLNRDDYLWCFRTMTAIRRFEQSVVEFFGRSMVRGSTHVYLGEEAVATGACRALRPDDYVLSTHRGHGHCIAKGADMGRMMAEVLGRATGYCQGKGGSMHIADFDLNMLGANGIVGGSIPIAVGVGLAIKQQGLDRVAVCFFGDGAGNQGVFHEAMNMVSLWRLPVIYICENNLYAVSTHVRRSTAVEDISVRAAGYGMPGVTVDGNDLDAVHQAVAEAVERARSESQPSLIECKTCRWEGHMVGDRELYRTREEVEGYRQCDSLARLRAKLVSRGAASDDELAAIEGEVEAELQQAIEFAVNSPAPEPETATEGVYVSYQHGMR